jgi:cellobiose phosphorylase
MTSMLPAASAVSYGHFDDAARAYVMTDPATPRPWINYLTNRRLSAFISQNAGGLLWWYEPLLRRITRYHYIPAPADRPGFYVYLKDKATGALWNPHFAPTCTPLDRYECRHEPGITTFLGEKDGVRAEVLYTIPPDDDVMLWKVALTNLGDRPAELLVSSYMEFGLLEFMREIIAWCYLKTHCGFGYDPALRAIRYDYHTFEAPFMPRMVFGCTDEVSGYECSRDAFIGRIGSLERPAALVNGAFSNSEAPLGGHGCGVLGSEVTLAPGATHTLAYRFAIADTWDETDALLGKYGDVAQVDDGIAGVRRFWAERLERMQAETGDPVVDRFVNIWSPYNSLTTLSQARIISTDHMGLGGLQYRDTTQDALGAATLDPDFAMDRMRMVFATQTQDGGGCFCFFPHTSKPPQDEPKRSDNTVWQIYTMNALLAETGDMGLIEEKIPYRDGGEGSVYDHILRGLQYIEQRRGPRGLPTLYHADWNDGLAIFLDEQAESVMLGQQMVYSCHEFADLARRLGRDADAAWCDDVAVELSGILNSDLVWDGSWYRRLLLSNGKVLGSDACREGKIFVNAQSWAVISGIGAVDGRGVKSMDAVARMLDSDLGLALLAPPYTGIPEPEDPPLGSSPGTNENGSIFCHANTWAIIAECLLGRADRAFKYYRQLLPPVVTEHVGADHYGREPYVYVSSIVGPVNDRFGQGGISWLTGTASWMYVAATQYLLGVRPTLDGLSVQPCLPASLPKITVTRLFRGCDYRITIDNARTGRISLELDGKPIAGTVLPITGAKSAMVTVRT